MSKSNVHRVVFSGEYHASSFTAGDQHAFYVDAPVGYRVVSANFMPIEDGNWFNVDLKGFSLVAIGGQQLNRVRFQFTHPTTATGNEGVFYQVVCERSDEPDTLVTPGPAVEVF